MTSSNSDGSGPICVRGVGGWLCVCGRAGIIGEMLDPMRRQALSHRSEVHAGESHLISGLSASSCVAVGEQVEQRFSVPS